MENPFTSEELKLMKREAPIKNGVLTFDESTQDIQFLTITNNEELKEVRIITPQPNLRYLDLGRCKIEKFVVSAKCENLRAIYLQRNQLTHFEINAALPVLELLDLSYNENLSELGISVNLPKLKFFYLHACNLKDLSAFSAYFTKKDFDFNIEKNKDLQAPPPEILEQGKGAVVNWFAAKKKKLNEIKVILIGEAKAGKTSLIKRLKYNKYNPDELPTDGIIIEEFNFSELATFNKQENLHGIKANFWDFGGQEIMNSTHQFFLTKRSVYLLVLEARKDKRAETQVREWMEKIKTSGGNSPVIVLANKIDQNTAFGLDPYQLSKEFPQIKHTLSISCADKTGIEDLKDALEDVIPEAELFNTDFDEKWFPVKEELSDLAAEKQRLTQHEFEDICIKNGIKTQSGQGQLIGVLNDLGIVLHFREIARMSEYFVLDPYWVTTGVYRIITSNFAGSKKGEISIDDLDYIVNIEERPPEAYVTKRQKELRYSSNELCYLAEIMAFFKLSYFSENRQKIMIPDLLDKMTPAAEMDVFYKTQDKLSFVYESKYLPVSTLYSLIIDMNRDLNIAWRGGVILGNPIGNAKAAVITNDKRVEIIVTGNKNEKREYLSIIRYFIDATIYKSNLDVDMKIPLPGTDGRSVKYKILLRLENRGDEFYEDLEDDKEYKISDLLNGIDSAEKIKLQALYIASQYGPKIIKELGEFREQLDSDISEIKRNQKNQLEKLNDVVSSINKMLEEKGLDVNKIEMIINKISNQNEGLIIEVAHQIMGHINWAFEQHENEIDEKLTETYHALKTTDKLETRIKLSVPLLNLIGVNIETELKLNDFIRGLENRYLK